jgi:hypothetical protein
LIQRPFPSFNKGVIAYRPAGSCVFSEKCISDSRASTDKDFRQGDLIIVSNGLVWTRMPSSGQVLSDCGMVGWEMTMLWENWWENWGRC